MNQFNFEKTANYLGIENVITTDAFADTVILGFIEKNASNHDALIEFLDNISADVPQNKWYEYFFRCFPYCCSNDEFGKIMEKAKNIAEEVNCKDLAARIFTEIEALYVNPPIFKCNNGLLKTAANRAYSLIHDKRYKLFADYAFIYTCNNSDDLAAAIKSLSDVLDSSVCQEDRRCTFYLIVLALDRWAQLRYTGVISEFIIQNLYKEATNPNEVWESDPEDENEPYPPRKFNIYSEIFKYNCPEVINIFDHSDRYYDAPFLINLHEEVCCTLEEHKYSSEKPSIISQKFVFLSQHLSTHADA